MNQLPITAKEKAQIASSIGEEVINRNELENLFNMPDEWEKIAYDGFELSGIPSLGQVFMKAHNVNQLTKCGCTFKFWIADYFTLLNNKMDSDMEKIRVVGNYMIEVWKAAGMDMNRVEFLWASDEINKNPDLYWRIVMDISKKNNLTRMKRCVPILGRAINSQDKYRQHKAKSEQLKTEGNYEAALSELEKANRVLESIDGEIPLAYPLYAAMQAADVMYLNASICQLGMDQKKVNMLVREYVKTLEHDKNPVVPCRPSPIIISHHIIKGLKADQTKASKSVPDSGIFVNDSPAKVKKKIKKAYCVPKDIVNNPILDRMKHIVLPYLISNNQTFDVTRRHEGDTLRFSTYEELEQQYADGTLHPADLKPAVIREINKLLDRVRNHFETDERAKALLELVESYRITR